MRFWDALLDNLVLVHVLIPCVTWAAIRCWRRDDLRVIRFVALQGCLLFAASGIAILLRIDPSLPTDEPIVVSQLVTSAAWRPLEGGPELELSVGADGVSLWYLVSLPLVPLSLLFGGHVCQTWSRRDYCSLFSACAGIALAIAARDVLLLLTGSAIALISVVVWSGRHAIASRPVRGQFTGVVIWGALAGAAIVFGFAVAVASLVHVQPLSPVLVTSPSTDIDVLVFGLPSATKGSPRAFVAWKQQADDVLLAWIGAVLIGVGAWPVQEVLVRCLRRIEPGPRLIVVAGLMPVGTYFLMRIALPLVGEFVGTGQRWIVWPVVISLVWHLSMLSRAVNLTEAVLRLTMAAQLLAVVGASTGTVSGICGCVLVSLASSWGYAAWNVTGENESPSHGRPMRWLSLALVAGCPGGGVFAGLWLIAAGILLGPQQGILSGVVLLGTLGVLWLLLTGTVFRRLHGHPVVSALDRPAGSLSQAGACLLVVAILLTGVFPGRVISRSLQSAQLVSGQVPSTANAGAE
jgi:hypothetical protein